jgi:hypothetical protein
MPTKQEYFAKFCEAGGIDNMHSANTAFGQKASFIGDGITAFNRIVETAKGLLGELGINVDKATIADLKEALDMALDKLDALIDWPGPDILIELPLRKVAHWTFDKAAARLLES